MKLDRVALAADHIAAGRIILRPLRRTDAALIAVHAGDARVACGTRAVPHPLPPGAAEAIVEQALSGKGDEAIWAMDGAASGLAGVLGLISLKPMDRGQSEVSYWVAPAFWNTGFASDALSALVAANPQGNCTLFAEVFQDNPGSAKVLSHCGFAYLGDAEAFSVARRALVPTWTYICKLDRGGT